MLDRGSILDDIVPRVGGQGPCLANNRGYVLDVYRGQAPVKVVKRYWKSDRDRVRGQRPICPRETALIRTQRQI